MFALPNPKKKSISKWQGTHIARKGPLEGFVVVYPAEASAEAAARSRSRISPAAAASGRWQCPDWESQVYRGGEPMYRGRKLVAPLHVGRAELPPQVLSGQAGLVQRRVLLVDASGQRLPEAWRRGSGGRGPGDGSEDQRLRLRCVGTSTPSRRWCPPRQHLQSKQIRKATLHVLLQYLSFEPMFHTQHGDFDHHHHRRAEGGGGLQKKSCLGQTPSLHAGISYPVRVPPPHSDVGLGLGSSLGPCQGSSFKKRVH